MRKLMIWTGGSALAAVTIVLAMSAITARAADEPAAKKLAPADVPQKVMDAVKARLPGVQVTSVEKETENGNVIYDLELKHEGRKYEMDVKEDGTVMEIEKEVKAKDVPAAVTKAVTAKYPKAMVKEVMEVNLVKGKQETPDHYEVTLATADGKESEVVVSLDGKSVKEEAAEEKAKEGEKDKAAEKK